MITWKIEHGTQATKPPEVDFEACPGSVYVRKNIHQEEREGDEPITEWVCDMALMSYEDFNTYSQAKALENQSSIDETLAEILLNQMGV